MPSNSGLGKGYTDTAAGRLHDLDEIVTDMQRDYGVRFTEQAVHVIRIVYGGGDIITILN